MTPKTLLVLLGAVAVAFFVIAPRLKQPNLDPLREASDGITEGRFDGVESTTEERFDRVESIIEKRFDEVESTTEQLFDRVESINEERFDGVESTTEQLLDRVESINEERFDEVESTTEQLFDRVESINEERFDGVESTTEQQVDRVESIIEEQFDGVESTTEQQFDHVESIIKERFEGVESTTEQQVDRVESIIEERFDGVASTTEQHFDRVESIIEDRFDGIESTTEEQFDRLDSSVVERFIRRRERVRETCRAKRNVEDVQCSITKRIIYFWDYDASICTMGKVGSGTWRNHAMEINHLQINPMYERRRRGFVKRPIEEVIEYTKSRTHWITVRHPLTRLVSCFQDKYNNGRSFPKAGPKTEFLYPALISNGLVFKKTDSQQYLNFLRDNNESLVILEKGDDRIRTYVTFTEFLRHVVLTFKEGTVNRHWQTYGRLCSPCFFDYDYITTIETQDEDLSYLFKKFNLPSNPLKAKKVKETHDTKSIKDLNYYKDVPLELRRKIYHIYRVDMEMFGYDLPEGFWDSK